MLVASCLADAADTYPERTVASFDGSCSQMVLQSVVLGGIVDDPSGVHVMVSEPWARAVAMAAHRHGRWWSGRKSCQSCALTHRT